MIILSYFRCQSNCIFTPCQNGGTCVAKYQDDTFNCLCLEGFIGDYCETGNELKQFEI